MESYQQKILTQILNCSDVSFNQWICRQWKQLISIWKTNVIRSSHQCGWKVTHSLGINQFFVLEKPRMRVEYFKKKWHLCFTRSRCVLDWYRLGWCFSAIHAQTCPREWYIQDVTRECLIYAMILFVNGCKWATWAKLTSPADFCCCTFFGVWCHLGEYFFAATLGRLTGNLQKKAKDGLGGGMFTPFFTMIGTPIMGKMSVADSLSAKWTLTMAIKKKRWQVSNLWVFGTCARLVQVWVSNFSTKNKMTMSNRNLSVPLISCLRGCVCLFDLC